MKTRKPTWLITSSTICALSLGAITGFAQDAERVENIETIRPLESENTNSSAVGEGRSDEPEKKKGVRHEAIVVIGEDVVLKAGDTAETVVVIGGSAKISGTCDECVVIGGNLEIEGTVRRSAVAIGGLLKALSGSSIGGDVVGIGSGVDISEGATVTRKAVEINFKALKLEWLKEWVVQCVMKMRPLASQVGWVWAVAGIFSFVYLLIALAFPRPVQACVDQLIQRPATTFLAGLITKLFFPVLTVVLIMTGIGVLFIPFLLAALVLGFLIGKVAILEYFGGKIGRPFGADRKPIIAFLIGTIVVTLLYLIPVIGLITFCVISLWGLGAAVTATIAAFRRERPAKTQPTTPPLGSGTTTGASSAPGVGNIAPDGTTSSAAEPSVAQSNLPPPNLPPALAFPRATFWERMGAAFLDIILVCILGALVGGPPLGFLVALAYFAGMWAWKGTTIGGIVLKLQVVRYDGGRVTFPVALVRGIAAAFSALVLFLGFFWIAWDRDKQAWHDKIVGTMVVRLPYSTPLLCV
ncbi:MAG: RDD family protein [Verrucomicrobiota bacterium]